MKKNTEYISSWLNKPINYFLFRQHKLIVELWQKKGGIQRQSKEFVFSTGDPNGFEPLPLLCFKLCPLQRTLTLASGMFLAFLFFHDFAIERNKCRGLKMCGLSTHGLWDIVHIIWYTNMVQRSVPSEFWWEFIHDQRSGPAEIS